MSAYATEKLQEVEDILRAALAEQETEPKQNVRFPRSDNADAPHGWRVDPVFLRRVLHTISPDEPADFTPNMEEIENVLLALEVIPASLYTTPPRREWRGLTDEERKEFAAWMHPDVLDRVERLLKERNA